MIIPGRRKSFWQVNCVLLFTMDTKKSNLRRFIMSFVGIDKSRRTKDDHDDDKWKKLLLAYLTPTWTTPVMVCPPCCERWKLWTKQWQILIYLWFFVRIGQKPGQVVGVLTFTFTVYQVYCFVEGVVWAIPYGWLVKPYTARLYLQQWPCLFSFTYRVIHNVWVRLHVISV